MFKNFLLIIAILMTGISPAQAWEPTKPISVIIGNQPGSGNEVGFRVIAAELAKTHPEIKFVIELKPGADSTVAMNYVYEAKPDGYTIAVPSYMSTFVTNDIWQSKIKKFQYDSFTNVMGMGKSPLTIVANPSSSVKTIDELVDLVQNTKKPITFAVGGGAHRISWEYFMLLAKGNKDLVKFAQYPGPLQAVTAVASQAGFEFGIMPITIAKPLADAGKVRVLGITGDRPLENLPGVEPIKVAGKHIDIFAAWAIILPPNTPQEIVDWYLKVLTPALRSAAIKRYYDDNLIFIDEQEVTPAGFSKGIENLRSVWIPLSKQVNLTD